MPLSIFCVSGGSTFLICRLHISVWSLPCESFFPFCAIEEAIFPWLSSFFLSFLNLGFLAMPLGSAVDILATDDPNLNQEDQQDTQIYEKHDNLLHGSKKKKWAFFLCVLEGTWDLCHIRAHIYNLCHVRVYVYIYISAAQAKIMLGVNHVGPFSFLDP